MRKVILVLLAALLTFGAWYYFSPLYTLHQMKSAADARDAQKLSGYVDYEAVRSDLKGDMRRMIAGEMANPETKGFEAMGAALATAVLDPMIDAMVTPQGVEAMFARQKADGAGDNAQPGVRQAPKPPVEAPRDNPVVERNGLDEFRVRGKDPSKGAIIFRRHGLGWKMAGFDLPRAPAAVVK